ncbi:TPA: CoA transferase subunit A [Candidatus Galligastranaerophilus gallistercoris]|nr:CoA transferase subunit A [Candidatus Galligastranaerophilus gallistercoris]
MKKIISAKEAASFVKDNSTLMVGGFLDCGAPDKLVDALVETDVKNLTLICNDTTYPNVDKGKLVEGDKVKKVIASHIGTNPITGKRMMNKEIEVEILPMGTFVEKIRAFGAGLGGILTPTGVGTVLEEGKQTFEIKGKKFIFEEPLGADVAFIYGTKVDKFGNVSYFGTTRNFNTTMAMAADTVIVQADEIVDCLDPNEVVIPGIFIDYIVKNGEE